MTSTTNTGGLKKFVYSKNHQSKLTQKESREIDKAYERARIRKKKEKREALLKLIIFLIVVSIICKIIIWILR